MAKKILLVDDDSDIRTFVRTVLEENSYDAIEAVNGEEGYKKVKEEKPDLIILDVLMPRQSGIKMYRLLKINDELKSVPVIIFSAISKRTFLRSQEALAEFGGEKVPEPEAYVEKPVEPQELADIVKTIISK